MATRAKAPEFDILGNGTSGNRLGDFEGSDIVLYRLGDVYEEDHEKWGTREVVRCLLTILDFEDNQVSWFIRPHVFPIRAQVLVAALVDKPCTSGHLVKYQAYSLEPLSDERRKLLRKKWDELWSDMQDAAAEIEEREAERAKRDASDKPPY